MPVRMPQPKLHRKLRNSRRKNQTLHSSRATQYVLLPILHAHSICVCVYLFHSGCGHQRADTRPLVTLGKVIKPWREGERDHILSTKLDAGTDDTGLKGPHIDSEKSLLLLHAQLSRSRGSEKFSLRNRLSCDLI